MKKIVVIVSLFIILLIATNNSFACVCGVSTPSQMLENDDAVFIGKVTKVIKTKRKWQVKVSRVLKGDVPKTIVFYAASVNSSCESSYFKLNTTYLFFANKIDESEVGRYENGEIPKNERETIGNYEPSVCSWTDTLANWRSEEKRDKLKGYKDEKFLELLKKAISPKVIK